MRDVAIAKTEFVAGEKAITKIQYFQNYQPLFDYCEHPEVSKSICFLSICNLGTFKNSK